jgi:hypothetical protein
VFLLPLLIPQETADSEGIVPQDFAVDILQPHNGDHLRAVSFQQPVAEPYTLEHPLRQPARSCSFSTTASLESLEEDLRHDLVVSSSIGQCSTIGPCSTAGPCSASSSRRQSILSDSGRASRGCSVVFDTPPSTGETSPAGTRQASAVVKGCGVVIGSITCQEGLDSGTGAGTAADMWLKTSKRVNMLCALWVRPSLELVFEILLFISCQKV